MCSESLDYIDVTGWDLSHTTNINGIFANSKTKEIRGLNTWNTSNITSMNSMFYDDTNIKSLDLSSFNTSNVTNMHIMFYNCQSLKTIKASNLFVVNQVTDSSSMFSNATSIVGGNGTHFNPSFIDKTYARIDTAANPGYFTR